MRYALLAGALVVVAAAAALLGSRRARTAAPPAAARAAPAAGPSRPRQPPGPGDRRPALDAPIPLRMTAEQRAEVQERARGAARPGMAAFRATSDVFVDQNLDFARRQAESEGITLDEVRELTSFGLLVEATQRVPDVEQVLGRSLSQEQRAAIADLMISANRDFKDKMRALVAARAAQEERWALIRRTQADYLAAYYAASGMNEDLLDDLLAGNAALPGAPATTPLPEGPVPPPDPADRVVAPTRPR